MAPTPQFARFRRIVTAYDDAGWPASTTRRWERARLIVETSVQIGRFEQEGGHAAAVRGLMSRSTRALTQAI